MDKPFIGSSKTGLLKPSMDGFKEPISTNPVAFQGQNPSPEANISLRDPNDVGHLFSVDERVKKHSAILSQGLHYGNK